MCFGSVRVISTMAIWLTCGTAMATLIASDNFDYDTGEIDGKSGGNGSWSTAWDNFDNADDSEIVSPITALTYNAGTGATTLGGGNALKLTKATGSRTPVIRNLTGVSAGQTFYYRFLVRLDSDTWDDDDFFTGFVDANKLTAADVHNSPNLGLKAALSGAHDIFARTNTSASHAVSDEEFAAQTTYLLVAKFEDTDADSTYDKASLWVNPSVGDESSPDATDSYASAATGAMDWLGWWYGGSLDSTDILLVDDVAVSTTFDDAIGVPEPSSLLLAVIGLLLVGWRRCRTY